MKKLLVPFLLLLALWTNATTYYISTTGNDNTGTGAIGAPWRTLAKATLTVTTPGDIIHVNAGTYLETVQSFLAPGVSLEGDGVTSIIQSTWPWAAQGILVADSPEGTDGNQSISYLKFDGRDMTNPRGIQVQGRSNVSIHHCTIVDFKEEGIIMSGTVGYTGTAPGIYATGNSFHDNIVTNCSQYVGYGTGCLGIGGQNGLLIYNNNISTPARSNGSKVGWPIKYFNEGYLKGVKIYDNILNKVAGVPSDWNFCVELFNCSGLEMYGNTITGSLDFNFQGNRGAYPWVTYIHDNVISEPSNNTGRIEQGIIYEYDCDGAIVENNVFSNLANVLTFYCRPGTLTKGFIFRKNLCKNIGYAPQQSACYFVGGFDAGTNNYKVDSFVVDNNTFEGDSVLKVNGGIGFGNVGTGYIKNIFIRNNQLANVVYPSISVGGTATRDSFYVGYNNFWQTDQYGIGTSNVYLPNGAPLHYTNTHNRNLYPQFVDKTNFYLKATSPLVDSGINVGLAYAGTAPDKGYSELGSILNTCPVVSAGVDQTIESPLNSVTLAGSATDAVGAITSHTWTKLTGTGTVTTSSSYTSTVTGLSGTSTYELSASDDSSCTRKDTMQITVTSAVAPTVATVNPANASVNISVNRQTVTISFSEAMKASTLTSSNIYVTGISGIVTYGSNFATITFSAPLPANTPLTVNVSTAVQDAAGNGLASPFTSTFTTGNPPVNTSIFRIKAL